MNDVTVQIENISKRYRIGLADARQETLVGAIMSSVTRPVENLRRLRKLASFNQQEGADIVWALRDVSFEVHQGEVVGIVGRNGAGKSTLLKILSRITEPTYGEAKIRGRVASLLEVGTGFHNELTGRENVYLNGTILGMKKAEIDRKFEEIVEFSGVATYLDTPVKRYSSGMRVRLAFAVAAYLEPEVLLIDEVLAVGDAEFQRKCLGKMEDVAHSGRTVLFVSHNMAAVRALCNRGVYLERGKVLQIGPTAEIVDIYLSSADRIGEVRRREDYNAKAPVFIEQALLQSTEQSPDGRTRVEMVLTCFANKELPFTCEWVLSTTIGQQLAFGSPQHFQRESLTASPGRFNLKIAIADLPLAMGRYYFDFRLGNLSSREYYDNFERAISLEIENFDPYRRGRSYNGRFGPFHFPDQFTITQNFDTGI